MKMSAILKITIAWTPALLEELGTILGAHRIAGCREDVSTPELMQLALADEHRLERDTLRKIARALSRAQGELLDCDVIEAVNRLHDSQRSRAPVLP